LEEAALGEGEGLSTFCQALDTKIRFARQQPPKGKLEAGWPEFFRGKGMRDFRFLLFPSV
jgi:hypothetical protein